MTGIDIMAAYLQLDLDVIPIDPQLTQQVSHALLRYYMALPIGQENGRVTVAMAYPDNIRAQQTLARLLHAEVVPVFVPAELLQSALQRIYCPEQSEEHHILAWYNQQQWQTAVTETTTMLSKAFRTQSTILTAPELAAADALALSAVGRYELGVCPLPDRQTLPTVLKTAKTSLFFVRGELLPIRRILVVMRGFASDERALDWLMPFAYEQQVEVTLMPLMNGLSLELHQYHRPNSPAAQHLSRCLHRLQAEGIVVGLKYRHGNAVQQVVEEVSGDTYDLLVLAAEAEGDFVSQVITAVDEHNVHRHRSIFVLKPPVRDQQAT